jgi:DNA-binding transcriptional LysR family regulator
MLTLRQLEIFLAVARREHVTAAARDVHLSQSAVSAALRELQSTLGGPLFEKDGRRIRLNDRGRHLVEEASDLVQRAKDLVQHFAGDEAIAGKLRLGASSTIGTYLLPALVGAFVAAHADVQVDLEVGNSTEVGRRLLAHELDAGFVEGPVHLPQLVATPWRKDRLVVFVTPGDPLARRRRLAPTALRTLRFVMRESGSGTREVFEAALRDHGITPKPHLTFGHSEAVKQAVRGGLGVGCLSELTVRRELVAGEFVAVRVTGLALERTLWRIARRGAYASRLLRACLDALRGELE